MDQSMSGGRPDAFRAEDVAQVFQWIQDGESGSIIGVSNVGKSFFFQHLLNPEVQEAYLRQEAGRYIFLRINAHNLSGFGTRGVYSLILEQMETLADHGARTSLEKSQVAEIIRFHRDLLDAGPDELKIQYYFRQAVKTCLDAQGSILVLLFDHFDPLYKRAGEQLFYNLRGLRDAYKTRISYLVFTRSPLPLITLAAAMPGSSADERAGEERRDSFLYYRSGEHAREEFYELLQTNPLYLRPYNTEDAAAMVENLATLSHQRFDERAAARLIQLTGGHAGLLRICFLHLARNGNGDLLLNGSLEAILEEELLAEECEKIWLSLSEDERIALAARARGVEVGYIDKFTGMRLEKKGLVTRAGCVFSPLFELFVRQQKTRLDRPIFINENTHAVFVFGKKIERLANKQYLILKALYDRAGIIVPFDDLLRVGWPEDGLEIMHSLESLTQEIHRIRKSLAKYTRHELIHSENRVGYLLKTELEEEEGASDGSKPVGRRAHR